MATRLGFLESVLAGGPVEVTRFAGPNGPALQFTRDGYFVTVDEASLMRLIRPRKGWTTDRRGNGAR